jgi:hypothetical protein
MIKKFNQASEIGLVKDHEGIEQNFTKSNDNTNENQLKKGGDVLKRDLIPKFVLD